MPRWKPPDSRTILQMIADDETRPPQEREEARRAIAELNVDQSPPSRLLGRNANAPQSQADVDSDIESHFRNFHDPRLDGQGRREIEQCLSELTRAILAAFGNSLLWLFTNNDAEIKILIDLHRRTQSDFVREKTARTIRWIADYSPLASAKAEAQQFLTQLDTTENQ